jgi:DNA-binding NarL/FixJ family response regulator
VRKKRAPKCGQAKALPAKWNLTRREAEVLALLRTGGTNKDLARTLGVSCSTVGKHVEHILKKMGVNSRTAAVNWSWFAEK